MSNEEFLRRLEALLKDKLPLKELWNVMDYHREYFAEAGENAAAELDAPEVIAQRVLDEYFSPPAKGQSFRGKTLVGAAAIVALALVLSFGGRYLIHRIFGLQMAIGQVTTVQPVPEDPSVIAHDERAVTAVTVTDVGEQIEWESERTEWYSDDLEHFDHVMILGDAQGILEIQAGFEYSFYISYNDRETWDYDLTDGVLAIKGSRDPEGLAEVYDPPCVVITVPWDSPDPLHVDADTVNWEIVADDDVDVELP